MSGIDITVSPSTTPTEIDIELPGPSPASAEFQSVAELWLGNLAGESGGPGLPVNSSSSAYEAARRVKSGAGTLFGFAIYNSNMSAQFIQLHDSQTLPADTAIPVAVWTVAGSSNLNVSWVIPGRFFSRGIWLCNSSTGPTKTIGSADCFFDAQYV